LLRPLGTAGKGKGIKKRVWERRICSAGVFPSTVRSGAMGAAAVFAAPLRLERVKGGREMENDSRVFGTDSG
jgi:hypothetical protein